MKKTVLFICLLLLAMPISAQQSRLIPFKARVTGMGTGAVPDGTYDLTFKVYSTAKGGNDAVAWSETHANVEIIKGELNILLGQVNPLSFDFKTTRYIGITIGIGPEMYPRHQLLPSFQAISAEVAYDVIFATTADHAEQVTTANQALHAINADYAANADWTNDVSSSAVSEDALLLNNDPSSDYATASSFSALQAIVTQLEQKDHTPPPGIVIAVAGEIVPAGYLRCDGSFYPKVGQYQKLYAAIGDRYGSSNDDFRVPDYRGYFLRGWLHDSTNDTVAPDEDNRTYSGKTALNEDSGLTGNRVGTKQGFASSQTHTFTTGIQSQNHTHPEGSVRIRNDGCNNCYTSRKTGGPGTTEYNSADHHHSGTTDAGGSDDETRPKNITVMYVIRY